MCAEAGPTPLSFGFLSAQLSDGLAVEPPAGTRVMRIFQSLWSEAAVATDALPHLCPSFSSGSSGQFLGEAVGTVTQRGGAGSGERVREWTSPNP